MLLVEEALSERGARNLVRVTYGVAALEHLRSPDSVRPDLIVLDLKMPRMNGRELLRILKGDEDLQTIPVVVPTTSTAPDDVTSAYSSSRQRLRDQARQPRGFRAGRPEH